MKKIFTFLLVISALAVNAQSIKLFYGGNPMNNNDTVFLTMAGSDDQIDAFFGYQNTTSDYIEFKVKKEVVFKDEDADLTFCLGECYIGNYSQPIDMEPNQMVSADNSLAFHAIYSGSSEPALVKYTFMLTENESDQVSLYIYYNGGVGIREADMVKVLRAFPNPASNSVHIEYAAPASGACLVIKNLTGKEVYRTAVSNVGTKLLDISSFSPGFYLYGIESEGRMLCTKKLLVK